VAVEKAKLVARKEAELEARRVYEKTVKEFEDYIDNFLETRYEPHWPIEVSFGEVLNSKMTPNVRAELVHRYGKAGWMVTVCHCNILLN